MHCRLTRSKGRQTGSLPAGGAAVFIAAAKKCLLNGFVFAAALAIATPALAQPASPSEPTTPPAPAPMEGHGPSHGEFGAKLTKKPAYQSMRHQQAHHPVHHRMAGHWDHHSWAHHHWAHHHMYMGRGDAMTEQLNRAELARIEAGRPPMVEVPPAPEPMEGHGPAHGEFGAPLTKTPPSQ